MIYTLGYARWTIEDVQVCLRDIQAILVDVRHTPYTTKPEFNKEELSSRFGGRYRHVPAFGNVAYQEGTIELSDPKRGLQTMHSLDRPPILMCGCRRPETCHRSTVAALIQENQGGEIKHLRPPSDRAEPTLFANGE